MHNSINDPHRKHRLETDSKYIFKSSKCINIEKNSFIKIVFVSLSINRDMVLKWKLGQLVRTDLLPLKCISFFSTPLSFDSTVYSI